ncbi:glycoside hydrolase family 2 TIM barrel-domain containing protein [Flavicella sp.]|uniref:glycoside hydrolase family 2 TIM barrel-domain containing protein n=1 Tax=Flavicella sp. TaxID=2957742 RepID=UPI0026202153|nr:glycoside hydrolase family 2 TIM barrel-domain containing protein [Flavicella sp.]MDG1804314.1 glycoside hydrolase family 2 TIM barrel-domain containing protein [Flavicella sp.]
MKYIYIIITCLSMMACDFEKKSMELLGEENILLKNNWKFNVLKGDGSNYLNVHKEISDVIIDNSNKEKVIINGKWSTSVEKRDGVQYFGDDYLVFPKDKDTTSFVRFKPGIETLGYREVFVYYPFGMYSQVSVCVKHSKGIDYRTLNQRVKSGEWLSLGIFKFDNISDSYIEIKSNLGVVVDAVMLRPIIISENEELARKQVYLKDFNDSSWENIQVPGHWGMINKYSNYTGKGWYRNTFNVPLDWKKDSKEKFSLKFDGVYHIARVFLNGEYIGMNRGGFVPFEFDVTKKINFNEENTLAIEVDNNIQVGATWNWGGIIRDVNLVRNNDIRIINQYIHAEPNLDSGDASITLKIILENKSDKSRLVNISSEVIDYTSLLSLSKQVVIEPYSNKVVNLQAKLASKNVKLWHFDTPNLYKIETSIYHDDNLLHKLTDQFGIRKVEVNKSQLLLNGEPVRLAGLNRVSDHRYWGTSEPIDLIIKDVELMKNAGVNFTRIMHGTQNKKLIEECDKKGILIFEEINVRDLENPEFTAPDYPLVKEWLRKMIKRDHNHPSIVGWSVGNELSNHFEYTKDIISYVKEELDPHRLVTCVSNTGHLKNVNAENDPITFCDIIMQNCYHKTPEMMIEKISKRWPNKPIFFSEFGIKKFNSTSLDEDLPELNEWYNFIREKNSHVIGASLWTFNDYRSAYIETNAEENRTWGIVNTWRQKRRLYSRMQKENSPIKELVINELDTVSNSAIINIVTKRLTDYPAYKLSKHNLRWKLYNKNEETIEKGRLELPTLFPGDKWSGSLLGKMTFENVSFIEVKIFSPGGYVRASNIIYLKKPKSPRIKEIISGDNKVRVHFDKVYDAEEYFVRCFYNSVKLFDSKKTIMDYIDIGNLENYKKYKFQVLSSNKSGESIPSEEMSAIPSGQNLPPVIWESFIDKKKLVIGYSSETNDNYYIVKYGESKEKLDKVFKSNVKGMMTIDLENFSTCFFKMKAVKGELETGWSEVIDLK